MSLNQSSISDFSETYHFPLKCHFLTLNDDCTLLTAQLEKKKTAPSHSFCLFKHRYQPD